MTEIFSIVPAPGRALAFFAGLGVLLLGLLLLFGYLMYSSQATRFVISPAGLAIERTLYGRRLSFDRLLLDEARVVDLRSESELRPTTRTNGVGMPGYNAGWFRLPGRRRGLLFVTDPSRVVAVPTTDNYTLLLTVSEPGEFLAALREQAAP